MKITKIGLAALVVAIAGLFAFTTFEGGSIKGAVTPADVTTEVLAVSGTDTTKGAASNGAFEITNLKAGTYTVVIDAADPYKDVTKDGIQVTDGQSTDVGEIKLEK